MRHETRDKRQGTRDILFFVFFILFSLGTQSVFAQKIEPSSLVDSLKFKRTQTNIKKELSPYQVVFRKSLIPGLGQIHNKQTWLAPVIWSGVVASVFSFQRNDANYKAFKAQLEVATADELANKEATTYSVTFYEQLFNPFQGKIKKGPYLKTTLNYATRFYHRQRDLTVIVFALGWGLQVLQANVQAHLRTFDSSDTISYLYIEPYSNPQETGIKLKLLFD